MAITEETRHQLYRKLEASLGREDANVLMEHLPPVGWADVATKTDLDHLHVVMGSDIDLLRKEVGSDIDLLRKEVGSDIDLLRKEVGTDTDLLRKDMEAMELRLRADISEKFNRLLFQLLAAQAAFTTLVLVISRTA